MAVSDAFKENIHLLLTDVVLPQVDGRTLSTMLLEKRPSLGVLFISGYSGQFLNKDGDLEKGFFFLPKPFTSESLAAKVREALSVHPKPS